MFAPTHKVPDEGLAAWATPDPAAAPVANLEGQLPVEVAETAGAWVRIVCSNGWTGWVDGRRLAASAGTPPAPAPAPAPVYQAPTPAPSPTPTPTPAPTGNETAVFEPLVNPGYAPPGAAPGPAPTYQAAPAAWGVAAPSPGPTAFAGAPSNGLLSGKSYITVGRIIAAVGVFFVIVSGWADWLSGPFNSYDAYLTPAHFLLDNESGQAGLSLGLVILFLGLAGAVVTFIPKANFGPIVVGAIVGFVALLFMYQLYQGVKDLSGYGFTDFVGIGPFVAGFGGLLLVAGGAFDFAMRQHARHQESRS